MKPHVVLRLCALSIIITCITALCCSPLPTEPPLNNPVLVYHPYCLVMDADPTVMDFRTLPDGTRVFTRISYASTPPVWQTFISDGFCNPEGNGWSISVVIRGQIYPVGW